MFFKGTTNIWMKVFLYMTLSKMVGQIPLLQKAGDDRLHSCFSLPYRIGLSLCSQSKEAEKNDKAIIILTLGRVYLQKSAP